MSLAWKVLTAPQMVILLADGSFAGAPIDLADGYIHLSTAEQLAETVDKHFAGQSELHLAAVDLNSLGDAVRWEPSRDGQLFPHVYGELPLVAVTAHAPLTRLADGTLVLPHAPMPTEVLNPPPPGEVAARSADGGGGVARNAWLAPPPPSYGRDLPRRGRILSGLRPIGSSE